ncbi:GNAT family N-acetyltransferase [Dokdonella soli]
MATALRPTRPEDLGFLQEVYAGTRADELARTPWSAEQKQAFVRMQFDAQHTYYRQQFADAAYEVILLDGVPVGRLYTDRRADEIRILDIALLPEYRNCGIGSRYLRDIQEEAQQAGRAVRIHVEMFNPARRLYDRMGFRPVQEDGVYLLMEWRADAA